MWVRPFAQPMRFGLKKFTSPASQAPHPTGKYKKQRLGATESVAWEYAENPETVVKKLKAQGYQIVAIEQTTESMPLQKFTPGPSTNYCLVFGNEIHGVSEAVIAEADLALEIPQAGTKHSLNISVCLGIVVWEAFRKRMLGS